MDRLIQREKSEVMRVLGCQTVLSSNKLMKGQSDRRKGNLKGIGLQRKKLNQIRKGELKGIRSRSRIRIGNLKEVEAKPTVMIEAKKKIGKTELATIAAERDVEMILIDSIAEWFPLTLACSGGIVKSTLFLFRHSDRFDFLI